ncbi:MAG: helix-turn-helix domain-containing protein [Rhodospirillales bacterium]|nr:helix-turn-helix domain-containing protein [Rhodospirillales bacterium]
MTEVPEVERLLTLQEVAERWRVSTKTIQRLIAAGRLRAVRIGRNIRLHPLEIKKYESHR